MRPWTWVLLGASVLTIGGAALGAAQLYAWLPPGRPLPGAYIGGRLPPPDTALEAWLEQRRAELLERPAFLALPSGEHLETTFGALGIELDVEATAAEARRQATTGGLVSRLRRAVAARHGEVDVALAFTFDPARARAALARLGATVDEPPVDARIDLDHHVKVPEQAGRTLDLPSTVAAIAGGEREEHAVFAVATRSIPPRVTLEDLMTVDVTQVLGSFETDFSGTGSGRAINIARAARYLDERVIAPGETISFNEIVGPRTLERGFTWAPEIFDDELTSGVGGGVCQVASTLHAASVMSGLEIVSRRSHSRPSSYIKLGLDAMVIYGEADLKIRNPYPGSILIHAFVPDSGRLHIEFLGLPPPRSVEYTHGVTEKYDFYRRVRTKPWLAERSVKKQRGNYGYDVVSTVRVTYADGTTATRHYRSEYRPTPEVFWVGPEVDPRTLPELPEGAVRVEVDGDAVADGTTQPVVEAG